MTGQPLAIVPAYARTPEDVELLGICLRTLNETAPGLEALVVDDAGPLGDETLDCAGRHDAGYVRQAENGGFSKAVNIGLQVCLDEGRDAVLVNSDIEFIPGSYWLDALLATEAEVVGALLMYPHKRVQSAGSYWSPLTRGWFHRFQHGPMDLEELWKPCDCPCTAALQLIRHRCLEQVGLYDEEYELAFEDVDYAMRVFAAGLTCRYQPLAMAFHHESMTRGDGSFGEKEMRSLVRLMETYPPEQCTRFAP